MNLQTYKNFLPVMVIVPTMIGFNSGFLNTLKKDDSSLSMYFNWVGYTSLGFLTGVMYPISFPLFAGYVLFKDRIKCTQSVK
jgi:ABC-type multidrug transport system permease subunit